MSAHITFPNIYIRLFSILLVFTMGCSDGKKSTKETITIGTKKEETKTTSAKTSSVPVQLDNKGIGPVKSVVFNTKINKDMASKGSLLFKSKCAACHKATKKFIGPAMVGIYKKRSPEWVMNMIMNPSEMLKKDPVAKALLEEYNNTIMINQNIPKEEARAMVEWFRTLE